VTSSDYEVIVIGGGHAGVEAAWAAANILARPRAVALVTLDPSKIGVMSCNPAIGGLAKGQLVREIDALHGLMGLATDATGIQFRVLNTSKGPAVHGPRAQCDKHAYARAVQALIASRPEIEVVHGSVERLLVEPIDQARRSEASWLLRGVVIDQAGSRVTLAARAVVLTTGTFMRGLMHSGESRTPGGRFGEAAAVAISAHLAELGFELGRLKTGTPPRLDRATIDWDGLEPQWGDQPPRPFSALSPEWSDGAVSGVAPAPGHRRGRDDDVIRACLAGVDANAGVPPCFPVLPQVECRQTATNQATHDLIRANLHRAPMYCGQIQSAGPRYCPSIEDKVVRFAQRESHGVYLEPESHADDWIYCNGISTSLPHDVQDAIVRAMPGCEGARILRYGYAVEYDMVRPHQIRASGATKLVDGLFLAGQINGTSGYEEAAAQGLLAGVNAARRVLGVDEFTFSRDEAYIGVLMDDLCTKTPVEPYRMFTSRAEHRLLLRSDNAADRLTPRAMELGLLADDRGPRARARRAAWALRRDALDACAAIIDDPATARRDGSIARSILDPSFDEAALKALLHDHPRLREVESRHARPIPWDAWLTAFADRRYAAYIAREHREIARRAALENTRIPASVDYSALAHLRTEARLALERFRPTTFGQAGRLEGITPADVTLLAVLLDRSRTRSCSREPAQPAPSAQPASTTSQPASRTGHIA
jgi:tRNA uridine 5-carboxymethylaminomethyl modification enzyme